jgi:uncharacterized membrane protein
MSALLQIHIAAGALAMIVGAVALLVRKGGTLHRRSGQLFVGSMLILPEPFTTPFMRILPIALVFIAMFYWLWRVRGRRNGSRAIMTRHGGSETANAAAE